MSMKLEAEIDRAIGRYCVGDIVSTDDVIKYLSYPNPWTRPQVNHYLRLSKRVKRYGLGKYGNITYYEVIA